MMRLDQLRVGDKVLYSNDPGIVNDVWRGKLATVTDRFMRDSTRYLEITLDDPPADLDQKCVDELVVDSHHTEKRITPFEPIPTFTSTQEADQWLRDHSR